MFGADPFHIPYSGQVKFFVPNKEFTLVNCESVQLIFVEMEIEEFLRVLGEFLHGWDYNNKKTLPPLEGRVEMEQKGLFLCDYFFCRLLCLATTHKCSNADENKIEGQEECN